MRWTECAAAGVVALPLLMSAAQAEDMVVVAARGIALEPGQKIDATKPLKLVEGQHITLIALNGLTFKLDGPFDKAPASVGGAGAAPEAIAALLTQQGPRTGEAGVTRSGASVANLPDPWVLDVSRTGTVCLLQDHRPIFWRPSSAQATRLSVMPADRSWKAEATWPAGSNELIPARDIAIHPNSVFFIALGGGEEAAVSVSFVPKDLDNDAMRVAWLADQGCEAQAEALQRSRR
ncbi:MAG TPA: hypothetical protein VMU87_05045 [Stellaceae bacterium]|nr:hypothetical protein [Stellaceae bacterium]